MTTIQLALGRILAHLALWLLEPHDGEPFDVGRSRQIDELVDRLDRVADPAKSDDTKLGSSAGG